MSLFEVTWMEIQLSHVYPWEMCTWVFALIELHSHRIRSDFGVFLGMALAWLSNWMKNRMNAIIILVAMAGKLVHACCVKSKNRSQVESIFYTDSKLVAWRIELVCGTMRPVIIIRYRIYSNVTSIIQQLKWKLFSSSRYSLNQSWKNWYK